MQISNGLKLIKGQAHETQLSLQICLVFTLSLFCYLTGHKMGQKVISYHGLQGNSLFEVISTADTSHESGDASSGFGMAVQNPHINHRFSYAGNTMLLRKAVFFFFSASCELCLHHSLLTKYLFLTVSSIVIHCY